MPSYTDATPGYYPGECLVYEANRDYSRDNITIAQSAGKVANNMVLGKITASGKYVPIAPAANDGSQTAAAVLPTGVDATNGDVVTGAWTRGVALNGAEINYNGATAAQITAINTQLAAQTIMVRAGG